MPTYRVAAIFFVLPLLLLGLFLPLSLFAAEDQCDPASEAGKGIVTNDCIVCITDANTGKKKAVGAMCLVSGGSSNTKANCQADASVFAGQCKVTYVTPDGEKLTAIQASQPSPDQKPPMNTTDLKSIYNNLVGEGSQAYVPKELNTGPSSAWLGEIDKAFIQQDVSTPTPTPTGPTAADKIINEIAGPYTDPFFNPKGPDTFDTPPPTSLTPGVSGDPRDLETLIPRDGSGSFTEPIPLDKPHSPTDTFKSPDDSTFDQTKAEENPCASYFSWSCAGYAAKTAWEKTTDVSSELFGWPPKESEAKPATEAPKWEGGSNLYLANQRAALIAEIDSDPHLRQVIGAVIATECSGGGACSQAVIESMVNRSVRRGYDSLYGAVYDGFYGPVNRGVVDQMVGRGVSAHDLTVADSVIEAVRSGSNVCNFCTDQGMINEIKGEKWKVGAEYFGHWLGDPTWANQQRIVATQYDTQIAAPAPSSQYEQPGYTPPETDIRRTAQDLQPTPSYTPNLTTQGTWGGLPEPTHVAYDVTTLQNDTTFTSIPRTSFEDFQPLDSAIQTPSPAPPVSFYDFQQLDTAIEKTVTPEPIASYEVPSPQKGLGQWFDEQRQSVWGAVTDTAKSAWDSPAAHAVRNTAWQADVWIDENIRSPLGLQPNWPEEAAPTEVATTYTPPATNQLRTAQDLSDSYVASQIPVTTPFPDPLSRFSGESITTGIYIEAGREQDAARYATVQLGEQFADAYGRAYTQQLQPEPSQTYAAQAGTELGTQFAEAYGKSYAMQQEEITRGMQFAEAYGKSYAAQAGTELGAQFADAYGRAYAKQLETAPGQQFAEAYGKSYAAQVGTELGAQLAEAYGRSYGTQLENAEKDLGRQFAEAYAQSYSRQVETALGTQLAEAYGKSYAAQAGTELGTQFAEAYGRSLATAPSFDETGFEQPAPEKSAFQRYVTDPLKSLWTEINRPGEAPTPRTVQEIFGDANLRATQDELPTYMLGDDGKPLLDAQGNPILSGDLDALKASVQQDIAKAAADEKATQEIAARVENPQPASEGFFTKAGQQFDALQKWSSEKLYEWTGGLLGTQPSPSLEALEQPADMFAPENLTNAALQEQYERMNQWVQANPELTTSEDIERIEEYKTELDHRAEEALVREQPTSPDKVADQLGLTPGPAGPDKVADQLGLTPGPADTPKPYDPTKDPGFAYTPVGKATNPWEWWGGTLPTIAERRELYNQLVDQGLVPRVDRYTGTERQNIDLMNGLRAWEERLATPPRELPAVEPLAESLSIPAVGDATTPYQLWGSNMPPVEERRRLYEYLASEGLAPPTSRYMGTAQQNLDLIQGLRKLQGVIPR